MSQIRQFHSTVDDPDNISCPHCGGTGFESEPIDKLTYYDGESVTVESNCGRTFEIHIGISS